MGSRAVESFEGGELDYFGVDSQPLEFIWFDPCVFIY